MAHDAICRRFGDDDPRTARRTLGPLTDHVRRGLDLRVAVAAAEARECGLHALEPELGRAAPGVVLLERQLRRGLLVAEDPAIVMRLKGGCGAELGHRSLDAALDRVGLALAEGEQDARLRLADRADAHRERAGRDFLFLALEEQAGVVLDRGGRQVHAACAALERGAGLVERDVSVAADAEHLDVDAAGLLDLGLVGLALLVEVLGETVEDVGVGELDVDLLEQVLVHEVAVALVVGSGEPDVLVEVPALDLLVADLLRLDGLGHLIVHEDRGGARREAQDGLRVLLDGGGDHRGRELRGLFLCLADYDFHFLLFLSCLLDRTSRCKGMGCSVRCAERRLPSLPPLASPSARAFQSLRAHASWPCHRRTSRNRALGSRRRGARGARAPQPRG